LVMCSYQTVFFFSSRRRHTRFSRDWSSDVCSSDLSLYEFTEDYLMVSLVFLTLSYVYTVGGHVRVTLFEKRIPARVNVIWRRVQIGRASGRERGGSAVGAGAAEPDDVREGGDPHGA